MFYAMHVISTENLSTRSSEEHLIKQIAIQNIQIDKLYEQLDRQSELLQAYQTQICQVNPSAFELPSIPKDTTNNAINLYL